MAGITNANFVMKLIPFGFDMVTLGGYNTDSQTVAAGKKILSRGRSEFDIAKDDLINTIEKETNLIKNKYNVKVSANLRAISPDPIIEISKIKLLDIVEVNCHCRQKEILDIGCGQSILEDTDFLINYIKNIVKKSKSQVSVKIRANVEGIDTLKVAKIIDNLSVDYLHIDAMKPGFNYADLDIISKIASETDTFLIGNNSIRDIEDINAMINNGADGVSIARAAINGKINFNLKQV
ncbi:MAG: tRNA-dihydrouridine synthase [Methanobacteriaceae archaeon]|jgi:TIM-barrel protein|nr:tRNA-dihydrouridine synthase [Candidatus Methanorudis spinitermitis]